MDGWIGSFHLGSIICCFFLRRDFFFHFNIARFSIIVVYISNVELFFFCVRQEKIENWIVLIEKIWGED